MNFTSFILKKVISLSFLVLGGLGSDLLTFFLAVTLGVDPAMISEIFRLLTIFGDDVEFVDEDGVVLKVVLVDEEEGVFLNGSACTS